MKPEHPLTISPDNAVCWHRDSLYLIDQRCLPARQEFLRCDSAAEVADAIRSMVVRGAPAIGIAAAYGVVLAARECYRRLGPDWRGAMEAAHQFGATTPVSQLGGYPTWIDDAEFP